MSLLYAGEIKFKNIDAITQKKPQNTYKWNKQIWTPI